MSGGGGEDGGDPPPTDGSMGMLTTGRKKP
jgi:hypothetical protein